jgi:hypothetical protein
MIKLNKILNKILGKKEYLVTIINVDLHFKTLNFDSLKEVDKFVNEVNNETYYIG